MEISGQGKLAQGVLKRSQSITRIAAREINHWCKNFCLVSMVTAALPQNLLITGQLGGFTASLLLCSSCQHAPWISYFASPPPYTHYTNDRPVFFFSIHMLHTADCLSFWIIVVARTVPILGDGSSVSLCWRVPHPLSYSLHLAASTPLLNAICFPPVLIKPLYPHASLCSDAVLFNSQYPVVFSNTCFSIPFPYVCYILTVCCNTNSRQ